jgi:hypothetical protein
METTEHLYELPPDDAEKLAVFRRFCDDWVALREPLRDKIWRLLGERLNDESGNDRSDQFFLTMRERTDQLLAGTYHTSEHIVMSALSMDRLAQELEMDAGSQLATNEFRELIHTIAAHIPVIRNPLSPKDAADSDTSDEEEPADVSSESTRSEVGDVGTEAPVAIPAEPAPDPEHVAGKLIRKAAKRLAAVRTETWSLKVALPLKVSRSSRNDLETAQTRFAGWVSALADAQTKLDDLANSTNAPATDRATRALSLLNGLATQTLQPLTLALRDDVPKLIPDKDTIGNERIGLLKESVKALVKARVALQNIKK